MLYTAWHEEADILNSARSPNASISGFLEEHLPNHILSVSHCGNLGNPRAWARTPAGDVDSSELAPPICWICLRQGYRSREGEVRPVSPFPKFFSKGKGKHYFTMYQQHFTTHTLWTCSKPDFPRLNIFKWMEVKWPWNRLYQPWKDLVKAAVVG